MNTTTSVPTGWQPDPSGGHELRLFSPDGDPTAHVSNGGLNSYEEIPGALVIDPPRSRWIRPTDEGALRDDPMPEPDGSRRGIRDRQMALLMTRVGVIVLAVLLERN